MKRTFIYSIIAVLCGLCAISCTKSNMEPASIEFNMPKLEVGGGSERVAVGVKCNRAWEATLSEGCDWITLTPASADAFEALSYMIVEVLDNEDFERKAQIIVKTKNGEISASLDVIQGENGFIIKDAKGFTDYLDLVVKGEANNDYRIGRDLDLKGITLPEIETFDYVLDFGDHKISNWTTSKSMFNTIGANGAVMNLTLDASCSLTIPKGVKNFGFIATTNNGTIQGIKNNANVVITDILGGMKGIICGVSNGYIAGCENSGNLIYSGAVNATGGAYYGAIAGQVTGANAKIENCFNKGEMSFTCDGVINQSLYVTGIVGTLNSNAKALNNTNEANVTIKSKGSSATVMATGIACYAGGEISNCTNSGAISYFAESAEGKADGSLKATGVAGIAGYEGWNNGTATGNINTGAITLRGGYSLGMSGVGSASKYATNVAGIFGHMYNCKVDNCRNSGTVTSIIADIDNAASVYATTHRQSAGGIVGSSWGAITNCENSGTINVVWATSLPQDGVARAALAKNFIAQVGGISGGDYHSNQDISPLTNCTNSGAINYTCDSSGSNNSMGGIVGWPNKEGSTKGFAENCKNTGAITTDGYGKTRMGGISGGCTGHKNNTNSGKIYLKNGHKDCTLGGISGVQANGGPITGCLSEGEIISDVKLAGAQGGSGTAIGGIVGATYNQANLTLKNCEVKCDITAPAGSTVSMIVGCVGSNKAVTTVNIFGTETEPNVISGGSLKLGDTKNQMTADTFKKYAFPWGTGNPTNAKIQYNVIFK